MPSRSQPKRRRLSLGHRRCGQTSARRAALWRRLIHPFESLEDRHVLAAEVAIPDGFEPDGSTLCFDQKRLENGSVLRVDPATPREADFRSNPPVATTAQSNSHHSAGRLLVIGQSPEAEHAPGQVSVLSQATSSRDPSKRKASGTVNRRYVS